VPEHLFSLRGRVLPVIPGRHERESLVPATRFNLIIIELKY
jgi:hypothetical protein